MKPLEAMAMKRAVLVSSVGGMEGIVKAGKTGEVFRKGDVEDLANKLEALLPEPALREALGQAARRWVREERSWTRIARSAQCVLQKFGPSIDPTILQAR